MDQPVFDIVYIGNYTKDTIINPSGTMFVDGGAVNYAAHAGVRLGLKTAVVTHLAKEDQRVIEKLELAGVTCFPTYTPSSTLMKLEYPTTNPDIRSLSVAATAGVITADEVRHIRAKAAVIGTSLRGEVADDLIPALKEQGMLAAADMQGYVRVLRDQALFYEPWPEMAETLRQIDILKSDAVEAEFLTGEKDIYRAAQVFASLGPKEIVLTHKDGLLIYSGGVCFDGPFYPQNLNGRSGRGDTCLGSYVAMRLSKPPAEAGMWAAAVTSLKMEKLGTFDRSIEDVKELIRTKYQA
jgi:sugar/nucleoside kinase (ribokinase family)